MPTRAGEAALLLHEPSGIRVRIPDGSGLGYVVTALELRTKRHKDPRTATYDGLEILAQPRCQIGGECGIEPGDIIKSVNGVPITSAQGLMELLLGCIEPPQQVEVFLARSEGARRVTYFAPEE